MTDQTMWAIKNPTGQLMNETVQTISTSSWMRLIGRMHSSALQKQIRLHENLGYRAVRVRIEEIEDED